MYKGDTRREKGTEDILEAIKTELPQINVRQQNSDTESSEDKDKCHQKKEIYIYTNHIQTAEIPKKEKKS